ncbi:uncharacterized protein JCM6883_001366 [Sporobolomyces salmoneus]|uniref:uncharacterized protein n=1 Tax=Sporobolomyces salmoneus TaxID=183962 RepID=UPI00316D083B
MSWFRSAEYTPLPTSNSPSSTLEPPAAPGTDFSARSRPHSRWRKVYYALGGCGVVLLFSSLFVVPEEALPSKVSAAVGSSREAFDAMKANWGWQTSEEFKEGIQGFEEELGYSEGFDEVAKEDDVEGVEEDEPGVDTPIVEKVECSEEVKKQAGDPKFWTLKASTSNATTYSIVPRNPLASDIPRACLSQAVFSARLVSFSDVLSPTPELETLYALPTPRLSETLDSYEFSIPQPLKTPQRQYELQVALEFGYFPEALEGTCGGEEKVCEEAKISEEQGEQLRYIGERIEIEEAVRIVQGGDLVESEAALPLCTDLSSLEGYWSSLSYTPTTPDPCSLVTPSFPTPFAPSNTTTDEEKIPLWIHFVGDSNTRNMYSQFLNSLGNGHKVNALPVRDSKTHNGTHASYASRSASGKIPSDDSLPDIVVTWSWWYQTTPVSEEPLITNDEEKELAWKENLDDNRHDLLRLVDTNLADYLQYANLGASYRGNPSLKRIASTLRPHRTYLSLGSHSERLSVPGSISSLDFLLDKDSGLSRSKRDTSNLRIFTTTHVNPTYIPLDRFPHQDLVRQNAFISAKNSVTRSRPEFTEAISTEQGAGGRTINVEALTRGITLDAEWMKPGKNGRSPDAVHFREEVYGEWVRLVWTDLARGVEMASIVLPVDDRRRWKKSRIEDWDDEEEF